MVGRVGGMRKKLDTRFPAARIKKIMQADEDVGKIAMAVPLLVSKALELFLQDLCDRTYEITLNKGAKTVNSLHLKQCVQSFNVFDFLRETVSKVPDLGGSDAVVEDRSATKRRKISEDEEYANGDVSKRIYTLLWVFYALQHEIGHTNNSGRSRGRGRVRSRGRGSRVVQRESIVQYEKIEDEPGISNQNGENQKGRLGPSNNVVGAADSRITGEKDAEKSVIDIDLNVDLNESEESTLTLADISSDSSIKTTLDLKHEDIPGWSIEDVERMAIGPVQLANLNRGIDEEEEDYDEEG
ncbi:dr1-associated corepressor-like isoform X1 [Sesamum indicum]|uniref:Dr1-associated corepressor-like isoform X1 n=1 Tax=Sesamum indicum TaxID=4182 RepID=A0A6I9U174_SESIN|nr:dr1-associated corepressor-like isoform X1 [Sesamum indicum]XP_011090217.1 dr1-associated corepressor-like isoform X1 [Sesamum indicum]XP_020552391.1 dr1-associated corepressor-like isoform X1 [Sesamum indicum]XP_020552392.1 dr1-associated corepressor-like isoform X1 [Sesamum indicum]XP_020552393.1 dr1-associated corepressor-like isoform X1 [Sesamum indicum]XP_020552394.1 dr1-associated corepressor-like isoform X1 [Sesamum indicum]XP_020552395.1 dr1-associated corepressor-like isoform X1 [